MLDGDNLEVFAFLFQVMYFFIFRITQIERHNSLSSCVFSIFSLVNTRIAYNQTVFLRFLRNWFFRGDTEILLGCDSRRNEPVLNGGDLLFEIMKIFVN